MKEYRSASGERRLWYEPSEVEAIAADELLRAGLLPSPRADDVAIDVEAFVERHLGIPLDQYADLDSDVLGVTHFRSGSPPSILINRDLTGALDDGAGMGVEGRWRATVAHEAAHVLLHRMLFELDDLSRGLFSSEATASDDGLRCLKRNVSFREGVSDWREVQANMGMAALLMPRPVMLPLLRREFPDGVHLDRQSAVQYVADRFNVSRQAASIRLERIGAAATPAGEPLL